MREVKKEILINKQFEQVSFCAPLPFHHLSYENPADCQTGQPGQRFYLFGKYFVQDVCERNHGVFCLLHGIGLSPDLDKQRFRTVMHVEAVTFEVNFSCVSWVIFCCGKLHLKRECQIIRYVWIVQIGDIPQFGRSAQSVKKHYFCHVRSIHICDKPCILSNAISVKVDDHVDARVVCQYLL